jgi:hypothetical protein
MTGKQFPCKYGCGTQVTWAKPYVQGAPPVNIDGSKHDCPNFKAAGTPFAKPAAEKTETKDSTNSPKPGNSNPVTKDMFFAGIEQLIRELQSMKRELIAELRAGLRPAPVEYDESEGPI